MAKAKPADTHDKKKRHRSPAYPAVGLRDAVERVTNLYKQDGKAGAPQPAAVKHIGFSREHGQALAVLSALKKYGLVDDDKGRIVPTAAAIEIIEFGPAHPRGSAAIERAATMPEIYNEFVDRYRANGRLPSDESLKPELITDRKFNPKAVDGFLKDFRDTLVYSGLTDENGIFLSSAGTTAQGFDPFAGLLGGGSMPSGTAPKTDPPPAAASPLTPSRPLSVLIGFTEDGQAIYAHVAFDMPVRKGFLTRLGEQLKSMEDNVDDKAKKKQ